MAEAWKVPFRVSGAGLSLWTRNWPVGVQWGQLQGSIPTYLPCSSEERRTGLCFVGEFRILCPKS